MFDDNHVQCEKAMDNDGNFIPEIDPQVFLSSNQAEDIALVCNQGYYVDDNNKPAPENVPGTTAPLTVDNEGLFEFQYWGVEHHVDPMDLYGLKKTLSFHEFNPCRSVSLSIFLNIFPLNLLWLILLEQTNNNLEQEMEWGELLRYLGLWFLMSSVRG